MSVFSRLTALVAGLAIIMGTMVATPASALGGREKRALGVILGVGAATVLLNQINDDKKDRKNKDHQARTRYNDQHRGWGNDNGHNRQGRYDDRRHDRRANAGSYSAACISQLRGRNGWSEVVDKRCADNTSRSRIPQSCAFDIRQNGHRQTVYGKNCLDDRGFRTSRR